MQTLLRNFLSSVFTLIIPLTLMVPYESANAAFVVEIDDPDTQAVEFRCEDGQQCDLAGGDAGVIQFVFDDGTTTVTGNASSKPTDGSAKQPILILDIEGVETTEDSIDIRVTDTDFTVDSQIGTATASNVTFATDGSLEIACFADTNNMEFGTSGGQICVIPILLPQVDGGGTTQAVFPEVGSLTLVASITDTGGAPPIDGSFTAMLDLSTVPFVVGQSVVSATTELEDAGYVVETTLIEDCSVPPGRVVDQSPDAGTSLATGSIVTITVTTNCSTVPNLGGFQIEIDDPNTPDVDFRCRDGQLCDLADGDAGVIQFVFDDGTTTVTGNATSKPTVGSATQPILIMDIEGVETTEDSIDIRVTDTDFNVDSIAGTAIASNVTFETQGTLEFGCFADSNNEPFEVSSTQICIIPFILPQLDGEGTTMAVFPDVGSLTLFASIRHTGGLPPIDGSFTARLDLSTVPNVVGLSEAEATTVLEDAGYGVIRGSIDDCEIPLGTVVDQFPNAGAPLATGSDVNIAVVGSVCPNVPNVVGLSEAEATTVLEDAGYGVTTTVLVEDCSVPLRTVVDQDPDAGTPLATRFNVALTATSCGLAWFKVTKTFSDGNDETDVTLKLQCSGGSYAPAEVTVSPETGLQHEFVISDIPLVNGAGVDCTVVEESPAGYSAQYLCPAVNSMSTTDPSCEPDGDEVPDDNFACAWSNVRGGDSNNCLIINSPDPVDVDVTKVWETFGAEQADFDPDVRITLVCPDALGIVGGTQIDGDWVASEWLIDADGDFDDEDDNYIGEGTAEFEVIPNWYPTAEDPDDQEFTECYATENLVSDAVEVDNGCGDSEADAAIEVGIGMGDECTITNTVFFEGIPTLNQYGMAILALLMLAVGFVGMRRFV